MQALSLGLLLMASPSSIQDGTVIVLENSNRIVEMYTKSEVTHVAMILREHGDLWVYEATPREVRKLRLASYFAELGELNRTRRPTNRLRVRLYQPVEAYSEQQVAELRAFLESQLGRRYSIKGYLRDQPGDGVHCAELVAGALTRTGRQCFAEAHGVNPSLLVAHIAPQCETPLDVNLPYPQPSGTWCQRSWRWWSGFFDWCGWACGETWSVWR